MNKRQWISNIIGTTGLLGFFRALQKRKSELKILAYHRVKEMDLDTYLFDENLVDASVEDFDRQVAYLATNYRVMTLGQAFAELNAGRPVGDIACITFDDGFDDLYLNVFPILQKHNVPATMFLATGLIGTTDTLWSEHIVCALKSNVGRHLDLSGVLGQGDSLNLSAENVSAVCGLILRYCKDASDEARQIAIEKLYHQLDFEPAESKESRMLNWDMVKEMSDWGVEIGSHSVTHRILASLSPEEQINELERSKTDIERYTEKPCVTLAYPVGGPFAFNLHTEQAAKQAGYECACSYIPGVNASDSFQSYSLRRLHVDHTVNLNWFKTLLALPNRIGV